MRDENNTNRSASRSWILTLPASEYDRSAVEAELGPYGYVGQLEQGGEGDDDGCLHWQIYIENKTPVRFDTLRSKFPRGISSPGKVLSGRRTNMLLKQRLLPE